MIYRKWAAAVAVALSLTACQSRPQHYEVYDVYQVVPPGPPYFTRYGNPCWNAQQCAYRESRPRTLNWHHQQ